MKAVLLKDITFSYDGKTKVLDGVDFEANYGEISLIAGHSGEGKSTLASIICGIIPNVTSGTLEGQVSIDEENIADKKMGEICRKVGIVLQNADEQIVHKIVEDEIAFGCENLAFPQEKISKQIEIVCKLMSISPQWKTRSLSGGQKQRLITASTLAMGQKIIILDEPLANLDRQGGELLMNTLKSLAKVGYAILVVEHRLDMVMPYVDRVWHITKGKAVEVNNREEFLREQTKLIGDICPTFEIKDSIFDIQHVKFVIKKREILQDVSCQIPRGARVLLLGENGSGKTTLLRLIARLNKPTDGNIYQFIDSKLGQKKRGSKKFYKKVGVVYQNPDYQLFMPTVREEIELCADSKEYAERIEKILGVAHLLDRHPQSLSQGQKRLVTIASVVASKPDVLILDEPTVGQDYDGLRRLAIALNEIHMQSGNTMITVTHDVRCADALCDVAIHIKDGKVYRFGGKGIVKDFFS
ncbi:MAG: energy-coupling factor ABC transporter ATP-binding protein [Clostridia bacterium]|nr:energy-coupling factor ABC transporter ATP-binding protein [Clostridia bacterium]